MNVWDEKEGEWKPQWIHSKIILKQKGPVYLNYSCLHPEGVRKWHSLCGHKKPSLS